MEGNHFHSNEKASFRRVDILAFFLLCVLSILVFLQYDIWQQPIIWDTGYFLYMGQQILQGRSPYLFTFDHKTPLAAFVAALAMGAGRPLGLPDLFASRFLFLILSSTTVGFVYLVAKSAFRRRSTALLSAIIMMSFAHYGIYALSGAEPKILMILWGLIAIHAFQRQQWFLCGLAGGLSALSWQPGILFAVVPLLLALASSWDTKRRSTVAILLGTAIPITAFALYLFRHGALLEGARQTILFNASYLRESKPASLGTSLAHITNAFLDGYGTERYFLVLGMLGWVMFTGLHLRPLSRLIEVSFKDGKTAALLSTWYLLILLSLLNFQWKPDAIPLLPYLALWAAWMMMRLRDLGMRLLSRVTRKRLHPRVTAVASATLVIASLLYGSLDAALYKPVRTLEEQLGLVAELTSQLAAEEPILVLGKPEILFLAGKTNLLRYIYLYSGVDRYIATYEPGGFEGLVQQIDQRPPGAVVIARWPETELSAPLLSWIEDRYPLHYHRRIVIDRDTSFFDPEANTVHYLEVKVYLPK